MISRMDADVGRLFAHLKELKLDDNTLVVFSSDNGPPATEGGRQPEFNDSNGPLRGHKGDLYEGGIRVPFIVRWPGHIIACATSDATITFANVMPTLADIARAERRQKSMASTSHRRCWDRGSRSSMIDTCIGSSARSVCTHKRLAGITGKPFATSIRNRSSCTTFLATPSGFRKTWRPTIRN